MSQTPYLRRRAAAESYALRRAYRAAKRRWQNWRASVAGRSIASAENPALCTAGSRHLG